MIDLYSTLGVSKSSTPDEMKRAHRKKVKKFHPDTGGNPEQFKAMQKAYDILSNPQRKQLYDEAGKEDETAFDPELEVAKLICQIVEQNNVRTEDIVRIARNHLAGIVKNGEQQFAEASARKSFLRRCQGLPPRQIIFGTCLRQFLKSTDRRQRP